MTKKINTTLFNPLKTLHEEALEAYERAKQDMRGYPTPEKLKRLIIATAELADIRKKMENEFPEA